PDPAEQKNDISARQIPTSDAAGKKHVAADEEFIFAREETKAARAMPRHFEDLHLESEKISGRCFFDHEIRLDRVDFEFEAKVAEKLPIRNHRCSFRVATDGAPKAVFDLGHVLDVIDVAMGK